MNPDFAHLMEDLKWIDETLDRLDRGFYFQDELGSRGDEEALYRTLFLGFTKAQRFAILHTAVMTWERLGVLLDGVRQARTLAGDEEETP